MARRKQSAKTVSGKSKRGRRRAGPIAGQAVRGNTSRGRAPSPRKGRRPVRGGSPSRTGSSPRPPRVRRRRGKRLHYLILIAFIAAAGIILSMTVLFKVEKISVIGTNRYHPDEIIQASGITAGENLLRINTAGAEESIISQFPYVDSVRVGRRFPPAVEIRIVQSVPAYAAKLENGVALITGEGKLLESGDLLVPHDLPIVTGFDLSGFLPGENIGGLPENLERLVMIRYLIDAAEKTGFGAITNVDVTNRLNMTAVYEARLLLVLGSESDLEYKLTFLKEVIADLDPGDQARLDASGAKDKRVLVKWGRVEKGVFTASTSATYDEIFGNYLHDDESQPA